MNQLSVVSAVSPSERADEGLADKLMVDVTQPVSVVVTAFVGLTVTVVVNVIAKLATFGGV